MKMFRKVEINIPLLNAIKQIPKYAKFLKELCVHKRRKMKGSKEFGGVVSALTRSEESTTGNSQVVPKKCRDPGIFSVPCTIGECTFADAMLDLGASINVMPASIYRSLNFGDLEPTGMTIQLANRSIVQPLGVLEDVLVQVNELIFPANFYQGRRLIDTLVQFNIFEVMKHPIEDHSLFGIDMIEELVEEYFQPDNYSEDIKDFTGSIISCLEADQDEVQESPNLEDNYNDVADLAFEAELTKLLDQTQKGVEINVTPKSDSEVAQEVKADSNPTRTKATKSSRPKQPKAEIMTAHLVPSPIQVGQPDPKPLAEDSPSPPPPVELKQLPSHLKYTYMDNEQQLPVIIANNLHQEQED
ncbi:hypothetical protein CR513_06490, partial [Mucuna pruriens]